MKASSPERGDKRASTAPSFILSAFSVVEQRRDPPVAVPTVLRSQPDNIFPELFLFCCQIGNASLAGSWLADHPAGPPIGNR